MSYPRLFEAAMAGMLASGPRKQRSGHLERPTGRDLDASWSRQVSAVTQS